MPLMSPRGVAATTSYAAVTCSCPARGRYGQRRLAQQLHRRPHGTRTEYAEGDDYDQTTLNGMNDGTATYSRYDGGVNAIDPRRLVRDPYNGGAPARRRRFTAWSDKHPVYAAVSGPTGD